MKKINDFIKIRIQIKKNFYIGPGKVLLLEAILEKGSISAAAKSIGMSYKKAWGLIKEINSSSNNKIIKTNTGGQGVRGTKISEEGINFIKSFRTIEEKIFKVAEKEKNDLYKIFNKNN